ncbi:MAG: hypothetical protein JST01_14765 [Cyanobacteria bacterium SZAS TMP-1]|nr:hypothetical protein [Cyanobacteria bacterium SZAS TMP-1]
MSGGADRHEERPESGNQASGNQAGDNFRAQYFQCLAAGQGACAVPESRPARAADTTAANGSLELTNPFAGDAPITAPRPIAADTVMPHSNWTVAINLTTTLNHLRGDSPDSDARVYAGARNKAAQLLDLADSTRSKPITLVVQNAEPDPALHGHGTSGQDRANPMLLHTYIIRDGQINELPARPSAGIAADTEALLATAGRQAPSDRLAFISQSHGGGPHGIEGDTGKASLEQLDAAIKNGLAVGGRARLDLLDFDACSMGNTRALAALAGRAEQIIASPETETTAGPNVDAQNTRAIIGSLLEHPEMSAAQLGQRIVGLADQGANGGENAANPLDREAGTNTLAHYDAAQVAQFTASIDNLGGALNRAWKEGNNRVGIAAAIENTPMASSIRRAHLADRPVAEERDVKGMADNILQGIAGGTIVDADGGLKRAAEGVLAARDRMVLGYHGEHNGGYDRQGGVSMFLPGDRFLNNQARADDTNPLLEMAGLKDNNKLATISHKESLLGSLNYNLERTGAELSPQFAGAMRPLQVARDAIAHAETQEQYTAAVAAFSQQAELFRRTEAGREIDRLTLEHVRGEMESVFNDELEPATPGWNQFLQTLKADRR